MASNITALTQKAAACFLASADVFSGPFTVSVGDVSASLANSNLTVSNSNVVVFSSNCPASLVALPTNLKVIKDTSNVTIRFGSSNVLRANANRFSPTFSNGAITFSGASYSNPSYQPTQVNENPVAFLRDVQAPNISAMSNGLNTVTTQSTWTSNALPSITGSISSLGVSLSNTSNTLATTISTNLASTNASISATNTTLTNTSNALATAIAATNTTLSNTSNALVTSINNVSTVANAALPKAGGTLTGSVNVDKEDGYLSMDAAGLMRVGLIKKSGFDTMLASVSSTNVAFGTLQSTSLANVSSATLNERMRINGSDGRVGIGTTTPSSLLHVAGDVTCTNVQATNVNAIATSLSNVVANGATSVALQNTSNALATSINSVSTVADGALQRTGGWMTGDIIFASGRLGIGTATPGNSIDVNSGSIRVAQNVFAGGYVTAGDFVQAQEITGTSNCTCALLGVGPGLYIDPGYTATVTGRMLVTDTIDANSLSLSGSLVVPAGSNAPPSVVSEFPSAYNKTNILAGNTAVLGDNVQLVVGGITSLPPASSSTLYVKGGVTASNGLRVRDDMPLLKTLLYVDVIVGDSSSVVKTQTVSIGKTLAGVGYRGWVTYVGVSSTPAYVGHIRDRTTTSFTLVTRRVDEYSGWDDVNLYAMVLLLGV